MNVMRLSLITVLVLGLVACGGEVQDPGQAPASQPSNVTATAGSGYVSLTWEHDGAGTTAYVIYRETVPTSSVMVGMLHDHGIPTAITEKIPDGLQTQALVRIAEVNADQRSYQDTSVSSGNSYRYAVAAKGTGRAETPRAGQQGNPVQARPPARPAGNNPDPSRYLAVVVKDGLGNAVANALVRGFVVQGERRVSLFAQPTDENGVTTLYDFASNNMNLLPSQGDLLLVVRTPRTGYAGVVTVLENINVLNTVEINPTDERYVDLVVSIDDVGNVRGYSFQPVVGHRDKKLVLYPLALDNPTNLIRIDPGLYNFIITSSFLNTSHFQLWDELQVTGPTNYRFNPTQAPAYSLMLNFDNPKPAATVVRKTVCPSVVAENTVHSTSSCVRGPQISLTPQTYKMSYGVSLQDAALEWTYSFDVGELALSPAGGSRVLTAGGSINLTFATKEESYFPNSPVTFVGEVVDNYGYAVGYINTRDQDGRFQESTMNLTVVAPDGTVIHDASEPSISMLNRFDLLFLPSSAPAGQYTYQLNWDTGPFAGIITTSGTFEVMEALEPLPGTITGTWPMTVEITETPEGRETDIGSQVLFELYLRDESGDISGSALIVLGTRRIFYGPVTGQRSNGQLNLRMNLAVDAGQPEQYYDIEAVLNEETTAFTGVFDTTSGFKGTVTAVKQD